VANIQHNPADLYPPYECNAHAVEVPAGARTVYVSGLNGFEADGVTMPASFEEQARLVWRHLERAVSVPLSWARARGRRATSPRGS
jgi:2-iminobutanoate/2-iminopropanoate deaminase